MVCKKKKKDLDKNMFDKDLRPSQEKAKLSCITVLKRTVEDIVTLLSDARVLPQTHQTKMPEKVPGNLQF